MANLGRLYIWFVVVVAVLSGLPRLLLSRRLAEIQLVKLKKEGALRFARLMSLVILIVALVLVGGYFTRWRNEIWIQIAIIFTFLSAGEFFFQARFPTLDALVFQNRLLGILYLGLAAGSYVMLSRV